ncbi:MAG: NAD(P)-dependent oxidoreductase [Clostridia bacterium]|nr:NAD(P)-dependent oxidoreductase [Clostridia bacterium]
MKVLVTGANGYIGKYVVRSLLKRGMDVVAADVDLSNVEEGAEKLQLDIFQESERLFALAGQPDALLHLAWRDGFMHNADSHMLNLSDHYRLLSNLINDGIPQVAVMGSMHEVGYWEGCIDEHTPCNPLSLYGIAKDALRRALFQSTKGKDVVVQWLRGYYIIGDDQRSSSIFGKIARAAAEGKTEFPFTTGQNQYDFITVEELGEQIAAVIAQREISGIINCCSGKPMKLADQVNQFIQEHGYPIQLRYGAFPDRPYDSPCVWGDPTKIREILGKN